MTMNPATSGPSYPSHHEQVWSLSKALGGGTSCECECPACWRPHKGSCLCPECSDPFHDHDQRDNGSQEPGEQHG